MNHRSWQRFWSEAKRWLVLTHRWLGISICIVLAMWFASGIVMVYVGYPALTPAERLAHLPALRSDGCCVPLSVAWQAVPADYDVTSIKLLRTGERTSYIFSVRGHGVGQAHGAGHEPRAVVVDALSGERVHEISKADALNSAASFSPGNRMDYQGLVEDGLWLHGHHLDAHFPVHRVQTDDAAGNLLFVSSVTGEVVRDAPAVERHWNIVGAWLHWFYVVRGHDDGWRVLLITLSLIGLGLVLTGAIVGTLRWKFRGRYPSGSKTPFRDANLRWHHISGMVFAVIAITWLFSGFMSINPFNLMRTDAPPLKLEGYAGARLASDRFQLEASDLLASLPGTFVARQIDWLVVGGQPYLVAYDGHGDVRIRPAGVTDGAPARQLPEASLVSAAAALIPDHRIREAKLLSEYDIYYYKRAAHTLTGDRERPLPILRISFDDADRSLVYIDPRTGRILSHYNSAGKQSRWLFQFMHSWDLPGLLAVRPLWDILILSFLGGGLVLSVTGAVMGWRRLRFTLERIQAQRAPA